MNWSAIPAPRTPAGGSASLPRPLYLAAVGFSLAVFALPTLGFVARTAWTTEQGAHGPLVMGIALWLFWRELPAAMPLARRPGTIAVFALAAIVLPAFTIARIGGIVELEGYLMYAGLLTVLFSLIGGQAMRRLWFPLVFLALAFPLPETVVALATQPLKIAVSQSAVALLDLASYPVGGEGVHIYIGPYELLIAEACSGLNSLVSLTALAMLYVYLRHRAQAGYVLCFALLSAPIAIVANCARVLALVLLTYHGGEATGQGFLHLFAGLTTFVAALIILIVLDRGLLPLWLRLIRAQ